VKTVYTDRYAARIWLPGLIGMANLAFGVTAQPLNWRDLIGGGVFLLWAAYEFYLRRNRGRLAD
jgi:hypothetical protein